MAGITTHVLDADRGRPAPGVRIDFSVREGGAWRLVKSVVTNADGRTDAPILPAAEAKVGQYQLEFHIDAYLNAKPGVTELAYGRTPLRALHSFIGSFDAIVHELPRVTQPILLLRSRTDHVVPARSSALLLSRVSSRDVTEIVLENSFHVATLDHDADVIEKASLAFIERVTA